MKTIYLNYKTVLSGEFLVEGTMFYLVLTMAWQCADELNYVRLVGLGVYSSSVV